MASFQIFDERERASLRRAGGILRECLRHVSGLVRPGVTTGELDRAAEDFIVERGGIPAFKGYHGFTGSLCISVDAECVHGIPGPRVLREGEIVSLDGGVIVDGLYTDACVTVGVGAISTDAQRLLHVTQEALDWAVASLRAGMRVGDLSAGIERVIRRGGFAPVRALTGHGLGRTLHQFPDIPNIGTPGTGAVIPAGTLLAVEPIVSAGSDQVVEASDGWTLSTADGSLSAHSEHSLLVTDDGCEVIA